MGCCSAGVRLGRPILNGCYCEQHDAERRECFGFFVAALFFLEQMKIKKGILKFKIKMC